MPPLPRPDRFPLGSPGARHAEQQWGLSRRRRRGRGRNGGARRRPAASDHPAAPLPRARLQQ
eukprot:734755-Prorocentrum_minimum.AAC.1